MGAGASKGAVRAAKHDDEQTEPATQLSQAVNTSASNPTSKKMICTVIDSKTNAVMSFTSSVKSDSSVVAQGRLPNNRRASQRRMTWHDAITDIIDVPKCVHLPVHAAVDPFVNALHGRGASAGRGVAIPINYAFRACGGLSGPIRAITSSSDGQQFASASLGAKVAHCIDAESGKTINEVKGHTEGICALCLSRDGKFLLTASADCTVILWDLSNSKRLREVPVSSHIHAVTVNDESDTIAAATNEEIVNLWEARSCDPLIMFQRHTGPVVCVAFSRRGGLVASGGTNGDVFVWVCLTGEVRFHLNSGSRIAVSTVSFSHDAQRLISIERDLMVVWDLFTGQKVMTRDINGPRKSTAPVTVTETTGASTPRFTSALFVAGNLILAATNTKSLVVIHPVTGEDLLAIDLRAYVTCMSATWNSDVIFLGDASGNHYRLQLFFRPKDVIDFNLSSKPPSKEKGRPSTD